jgi:putative transposase
MVPGEEDGLCAVLGEVHRRYTRFINIRGRWCGHLWQERFQSFVMEESYLPAAVRYIERNPVARRLCNDPCGWQWSSAAAHATAKGDGVVKVGPVLTLVDDWRSYLADDKDSTDETWLIKRHLRTGRPLGSEVFIRKLETNKRGQTAF